MIYDSSSYAKRIRAWKRKIKQESKKVLKSDSVKETINYILLLNDYAFKCNVDFQTLDYKSYIEKMVSTKDEEKICAFITELRKKRIDFDVLLYDTVLTTLVTLIKDYYQDDMNAKIMFFVWKENADFYTTKVVQGFGNDLVEKTIIKERNPKFAFKYSYTFPNCNRSTFEDIVIESGNAEYIYKFARYVKGANIQKLEDAIIKTKDAYYIYLFALHVKDANIPKLEDALIKTKNAKYICDFALRLYKKGANIPKAQDALIEINDPKAMCDFALHAEGTNIRKLENAIVETKDIKCIYEFVMNERYANVERLCFVLIDLGAIVEAVVVISTKLDQIKDLHKFVKKFISIGQVDTAKQIFIRNVKREEGPITKNEPTVIRRDYGKLFMDEMVDKKFITREDIDDYLIQASNKEQKNLAMNIHQLSEKSQKKLLHTLHPDVNEVVDISTVRNQFIDYSTSLSLFEEGKRWLINFSLRRFNVLPSAVKDFKEVKENVALYLETLKKCDEYKYYYYKDAFEGKITFKQADTYYKYYCEQQLPKRLTTDKFKDGLEKVLKLKYSKK